MVGGVVVGGVVVGGVVVGGVMVGGVMVGGVMVGGVMVGGVMVGGVVVGGVVVGGVMVGASGPQSREPGFESSCCRFEALGISFLLRCLSSHSCINEYLATDRDRYLNE